MRAVLSLLLALMVSLTHSHIIAAQSPLSARAKQLVGCYALFTGGKALDTSFYNSSPRVLLDSTEMEMRVDSVPPLRFLVLDRLDAQGRLMDQTPRRKLGLPFLPFTWWVDSRDSVHLSLVDGFSGTVLILESTPVADTLRGRIANHWDFGPPFVTNQQSASAVRVPCHSSAHP